mmetsp:Transcript_48875/g.110780  ORF Transcript_48875/g.110780 Transcript_48875/m.110780 type:complete len:214 (+) Transcript_48875:21-662(+)
MEGSRDHRSRHRRRTSSPRQGTRFQEEHRRGTVGFEPLATSTRLPRRHSHSSGGDRGHRHHHRSRGQDRQQRPHSHGGHRRSASEPRLGSSGGGGCTKPGYMHHPQDIAPSFSGWLHQQRRPAEDMGDTRRPRSAGGNVSRDAPRDGRPGARRARPASAGAKPIVVEDYSKLMHATNIAQLQVKNPPMTRNPAVMAASKRGFSRKLCGGFFVC